MTTLSTPVPDDPAAQAKKDKQMSLIKIHCTINMAVSILNFTTRGEILKDLVGGDYAKVAYYMGTWTGVTAMVEFLLNPLVGGLSDTFGRKPFMVLAPYAAIILKTWVLMKPSIFSLTVERIVCDGLRTMSGTTMGGAAVQDLVKADEVGNAMASLWSAMGKAILITPLVAAALTPRASYKVAIGLAFFQLVTDQFYLEETLTEKKPFEGIAKFNPLSVVRLFTSGQKMRLVSITMCFQNLLDPKILADLWIVLQQNTLAWSRQASQLFTAAIGAGLVLNSKLTKWSFKKWGPHGHTTFGNLLTVVENFVLGFFPSSVSQIGIVPVMWASGTRGNGIKQLSAQVGVKSPENPNGKFGKGELAGLTANVRALMVSIGPFAYQWAFSKGTAAGYPGGAFILAAAFAGMAEVYHQILVKTISQHTKQAEAAARKGK